MIKIDVLLRAAEYLENSERSLSLSSSPSSWFSSSSSSSSSSSNEHIGQSLMTNSTTKRESREKCLSRSEKAIHNTLEKNRRAHLKDCFEHLQRELPVFKEKKKATNLSILNYTLKFIQQSQKKDKENEIEVTKLVKKKEVLTNAFCKYVYEIEIQKPEYKSLVYEQINNPALLERIEKAKNALKVNSPIEESSNDIDVICGESDAHSAKNEGKMQNIENRIDLGRSFFSFRLSGDDNARPVGSISKNPLSDQIKRFDNIRIGLGASLESTGSTSFERFDSTVQNANKLADMQILSSISSLITVENK